MVKMISKCRICEEGELTNVFKIGDQVLTGVFPHSQEEVVTSGPVDLVKCTSKDGCGLVQLLQSYDLSEMYGMNYGYRSSLNQSMVDHLHSKVEKIINLDILEERDIIIDIGSNDATTLKAYPGGRYELIGIDPTGIKFSSYYPKEIKLVSDFFSAEAALLATSGKKAKVITSFSMFYDLENPIAFAKEVEKVLHNDGVWVFEQSYLPSMLRTNSFDTICHEHLEFYTLKQINWIAEKAGLKVLNVEFNDTNGGSFSITAAKLNSLYKPKYELIEGILDEEDRMGLDTTRAFDDFKDRVAVAKGELMTFLENAKTEGKSVCGLGASTKGNVLLQYYEITRELVSIIGEVNKDKFGCFTPGTLIPLIPEDEVLNYKPDYLLVLPWHFSKFFIENKKFKGCKLIFPLPRFKIIEL